MSGLYEADFVARLARGVVALLDGWGLPLDSQVELLTVSENATFLVIPSDGADNVVVRVHRPGYHTRAEIASELAWIDALRERQVITTPRPLTRRDGEPIARFDDEGERRDAVAFTFMPGHEPQQGDALAAGFQKLGAISARLHAHARAWQPPASFTRKVWDADTIVGERPHWGPWQDAIALDAAGHDILSRAVALLRTRLHDYGSTPDRFGLIHADLRLANLLVHGDQLAVIDFDDCGFGWFCADFAAAISFIEEQPDVPRLLDAWLEGYRHVAPLAEADEDMIPTLVMLRRIQLTAWLASHAETPTALEVGDGYTAGTVRLARRYLDGGIPFGA